MKQPRRGRMNAIAVVDENWGLGRNGKLLVHLLGDLKYFKEKTLGKTIIIGRGTYESMAGKLLPGRETAILSKNMDFKPDCLVLHSLEEALLYLKEKPDADMFVAGGESVYRLFFPYCDKFFITKLHAAFEADIYFRNLDDEPESFAALWSSDIFEENGVKYQFFEYARVK